MAGITIRPIIEADKPKWEKLYHGYADHYQVTLTETGLNCTWGWLMDSCLLYTSPSPRDTSSSRMPSSA